MVRENFLDEAGLAVNSREATTGWGSQFAVLQESLLVGELMVMVMGRLGDEEDKDPSLCGNQARGGGPTISRLNPRQP